MSRTNGAANDRPPRARRISRRRSAPCSDRLRARAFSRRPARFATSAQAAEIAEQIVRQATASSAGRETRASARSTYAEFRSRAASPVATFGTDPELAFWRYVTARPTGLNLGAPDDPSWAATRFLVEPSEQRVLSKATSAAGGYLVPQDFDSLITSARRARNVIGSVARVVETDHGRILPLPTATAHGSGSWTSENAAVTASDDTFGQVSLAAYKAATKTIVSEELAEDALEDFDRYLASELGERVALLEESPSPRATVRASRSASSRRPTGSRR